MDAKQQQVSEAGKVLRKLVDSADAVLATLGEEAIAMWWYELRNEVLPVFDWMSRYGKVPDQVVESFADPTEPDITEEW